MFKMITQNVQINITKYSNLYYKMFKSHCKYTRFSKTARDSQKIERKKQAPFQMNEMN